MVEIREESNDASETTHTPAPETQSSNTMSISQYVSQNNIECLLNGARLLTVFFACCYTVPFLSLVTPESGYYKAFAAGAATSAIRLHQRVGRFPLSRQIFTTLITEDSCHYLFYSIVFLTSSPITMALLPIVLYAALNFANFLVKFLNNIGKGQITITLKLKSFVESQTANILGIIACGEIFLIPLLISVIFVGKGSLLLPFVYYRFLTLRYSSRRNPYTRLAFYQMRESLVQIAHSPNCPSIVRTLINTSIGLISRMAPVV